MSDAKCPFCGGEINWCHFLHWHDKKAVFIAECWSGNLNVEAPKHLFKVIVDVDEIINKGNVDISDFLK